MKTPMQELMDYLDSDVFGICDIRDRVEELLVKEKDHIKQAWWDGFKLQRVVVDSNADETYFNQKYNNNEGTTLG